MSCFKDSLPDYPLSSIYTGLLYLLNGFSLHLIEPLGNPETPKNMSIVYTYKTTSQSCHPWQLLKVSSILRTHLSRHNFVSPKFQGLLNFKDTPSDTAARLRAALRDSKSLCIQRYTLGDRHALESAWERLSACFSFMVSWCHLQYAMKRSRMTCKGFLKSCAYKDMPLMIDMPYRASERVWEPIARDNTSVSIAFL